MPVRNRPQKGNHGRCHFYSTPGKAKASSGLSGVALLKFVPQRDKLPRSFEVVPSVVAYGTVQQPTHSKPRSATAYHSKVLGETLIFCRSTLRSSSVSFLLITCSGITLILAAWSIRRIQSGTQSRYKLRPTRKAAIFRKMRLILRERFFPLSTLPGRSANLHE